MPLTMDGDGLHRNKFKNSIDIKFNIDTVLVFNIKGDDTWHYQVLIILTFLNTGVYS